MKISQRNFIHRSRLRGSARWIVIASIAALIVLVGFIVWQSRPSRMVEKKQAALISGIERRNPARIERLTAEPYSDRWGFDRKDIVESIIDVGSQFLALVVTEEERQVEIEGDKATVSAKLTFGGKPIGPAGNEAMKRLNRLKEPFIFTWEKESFLPASWRLVRIDNAGLPDELYGYEPGDIRRAMIGD